MEWRENDGVRWLEADLGGARAAFPTRLGGVSAAPFDSLNLGLLTDDAEADVVANRGRLAAALGLAPERVAYGLQVHGTELHAAGDSLRCSFASHGDGNAQRSAPPEADGQVLSAPGDAAFVFTADCLPVALHGPGGVALLHCGWRGLAGGIVARGAAAVAARSAAIGPGIGPCCFEVGPEVSASFADLGEGIASEGPGAAPQPGHAFLDLVEVATRLLGAAGVERVEAAGLCTSCEDELFFSHRRDAGTTGRQGGLAWIEGG